MERVCFDTSDRSIDGGSLVKCLSSWQGWDALGRGARAPPTPCLIRRRPISAFHPAWVKHTHPSRPLPCFLQGIMQYFAAIFLPPLIAVSQGWLCSTITDTGWRSGSNEYSSWVYQEEQHTLFHASFSLSLAFLLFFLCYFFLPPLAKQSSH